MFVIEIVFCKTAKFSICLHLWELACAQHDTEDQMKQALHWKIVWNTHK